MIQKPFDRHRFFRIVTWCWLILLTVLLLLPGRDLPSIKLDLIIPADKLIHFISLFIATGSFLLSIHWEENRHRTKIILGLIAYAVLMEFIQSALQSSRAFEFQDIAANLSGVLCALFLYLFIGKLVKN